MKKAILYKQIDNKKVQCTACKHYCIIEPEKTGRCKVRKNKRGVLYLLVYGKVSSANIDPIEKKPLYHFLPKSKVFSFGTVGCNFSCIFCQNWDISQDWFEVNFKSKDLPPEKIIEICKDQKIKSIAYTYNEPSVFFEFCYDTAKLAKKNNIKNIFVSNGYISKESLKKISPYLDAINIDLKSFSDDFYQKLCAANLKPVLDTIKEINKLDIWMELTTLLIPKKNDSKKEITQIAEFIKDLNPNIPWHISAFYPSYKLKDVSPTNVSSLKKAYNIAKDVGLNYVYIGNIRSKKFSSTYCPKCNSLLIERNQYSVNIRNLKNNKCSKCGFKVKGQYK